MTHPLRFAVIAGVGSGTGTSIARRFAQSYSVALLARNPQSYEGVVREINDKGGRAIGISADLSDADSVGRAFAKIEETYPKHSCAAAIYNASGPFTRKPFLETSLQDYEGGWAVTMKGAIIFSQACLPLLIKDAEGAPATHSPTLIFTGATASIKASAQMSSFAGPKFALRALSTSLAKEFAPKGVHVAHVIIDGPIDIPNSREMLKDLPPDAKIGPEDIAESYWNLHAQGRRGFTYEVDIRSMLEKW